MRKIPHVGIIYNIYKMVDVAKKLVNAISDNQKDDISYYWNQLSNLINECNSFAEINPHPLVAKALFLYGDKFTNRDPDEEEARALTFFSILKMAFDAAEDIEKVHIAAYLFIYLVKKFKYLMPLFHYTLPLEVSNYSPGELKPLSDEKINHVQRNIDAIKTYLVNIINPSLNELDKAIISVIKQAWTKTEQRVSALCEYSISELRDGEELLNFASLRLAKFGKYRLNCITENRSSFSKKTNSLIKDNFIFYADSYLVSERGRYDEGETTATFKFELNNDNLVITTKGIKQEYIKPYLNQRVTNIAIEKVKQWADFAVERKVSLGDGDNVPNGIDLFAEGNNLTCIVFFFIVGKEGWPRVIYFYGHTKFESHNSNVQTSRNTLCAKREDIPNEAFKRLRISQNYIKYGYDCDCQGYLMEQLEANPKLLAWLFDDDTLIGKSYLALDCERLEAFQRFYNSLDIDYD